MLKIPGFILLLFAVFIGFASVSEITKMSFPQETIGPDISGIENIRSPYQTLYWGYATSLQDQCISVELSFFVLLSLSTYLMRFKNSHSKWYVKIGKVGFCILFATFFVSATDFHYFDLQEWIAPVLFAIMAFFALRNKQEILTGSYECTRKADNQQDAIDDEEPSVNEKEQEYSQTGINNILALYSVKI